ncbi:MAG: hypothetical protein ABIL58_20560 [Pseudomonadota bacterium]
MEHLIDTDGYWAVLIGTFLEGKTILLSTGFAAHRGYLAMMQVILAAFAGSLCGGIPIALDKMKTKADRCD